MPRIRTIKPDALQHRHVGPLSDRAFRTWIALLTQADDEGRLVCQAEQVRVWGFAYHPTVTAEDVEACIQEIATTGMLRLYTANGTRYAVFPSFLDHQVINKATKSKLPPPPLPEDYGSTTGALPDGSGSTTVRLPTERKGKEGKGLEGKGKEIGTEAKTVDGLPDWFCTCLKDSPNFSSLLHQKHSAFWHTMSTAYDPYEWLKWDEQIHKADAWIEANPQKRPRQHTRFLKNWFERAVEHGRIQRAKEARARVTS